MTRFVNTDVEFHCGSDTRFADTDEPVPVNWEFGGLKQSIYCMGELNHVYGRRYSVNTFVAGVYILRVGNITQNDAGIYKCINNAGFGPEEAVAELIIVGKNEQY